MLFSKYCPYISIFGLGGVGKTQIVLEYIYRHQATHPDCAVFWVPALSAATFNQAYQKIGEILKIPQIKDKGVDLKQLVKDKLSDEGFGKWLLVVDNADSTDVLLQTPQDGSSLMPLKDYLPKSSNGSIIFTTRTRKAAGDYSLGAILEATEMDEVEAGKLFESYLAPKQMIEEDSRAIAQLLDYLTCLPLAIRQAAAFIQKNDVSVSKYLSLYEKSEQSMVDILSEDFQDPTRYSDMKNPVAATWLVSFKQIRHEDPQAANYLSFMSTLLRENIPRSLLPAGESDLEQTKAIGTLTAYSFLTHRKGEEAFDVHRLVYLATRNWLRRESKLSLWADSALRRLVEVIPTGGHLNLEIWTQYLPHGVYVADKNEISRDSKDLMIMLVDRIGRCQSSVGQYAGAEKFHRRALTLREEMLGNEHPNTLTSMNEVGFALNSQGKYTEAEEIHQETLALREKVLGKEHPETLTSMNNIGYVLSEQGRYIEAEEIYRETLTLREKVLGKEHPETLTSMNNIGYILSEQGKYIEAEEIYGQTLKLREKVLGKEHPETLLSMSNIGYILSEQGKYIEAEEIHRETLALREKVLGKEHPETLRSMNSVGYILSEQGKYIEAEEIHRETLALGEKVLGKEHRDTLTSMNNIGYILSEQGKYIEAKEIYGETLKLREKILGKEHRDTLTSMNNIGFVLGRQGKYAEAKEMLRETLTLREKVLGKEHPLTRISRENLTDILSRKATLSRPN